MERSLSQASSPLRRVLAAGATLALSLMGQASRLAAQDFGDAAYGHEPVIAEAPGDPSQRLYSLEEVRQIVREELDAQGRGQPQFTAHSTSTTQMAPAEGGAAPAEVAPAPERVVVGADPTFKASWHNGIEFETADKAFKLHIGGRTQFDGVWLDGDNDVQFGAGGVGPLRDSANFRRGRIRLDGTMYEVIEYAAEYDFVGEVNDDPTLPPTNASSIAVPAPTDLWFTFTHLPVLGNVRMGNYKEPIGLEHLTSSRYLDFMERSFLQDAFFGPFNNGFSPGIGFFNWTEDERMTWNLGVFKNTTNIFASGVGDGEYALTGRMTWLPWYENEGRQLLHVGIAGSHRDLDEDSIRFRARPSLRTGSPGPFNPVIANTGVILGDDQDLLAAEGLAILGPLQFQTEYVMSWVSDASQGGIQRGDVFFHGYYAECLYFLTGESRPYNRKSGAPDRIIPYTNYFFVKSPCGPIWGSGAWQVGVRYSWLDLRDSGIDGGVVQDVTCGLNWFLNPNMKLQWNYVFTYRDAPGGTSDGDIHGFGMRVAHDF